MKMVQQPSQTASNYSPKRDQSYQAPAVVYEGVITTRAGSPFGNPDDAGVDPTDLFGSNK